MENSKENINNAVQTVEVVESTSVEAFNLFDEVGEAMLAMERVANTKAVEKATVGDWLPFLDLSQYPGKKVTFLIVGVIEEKQKSLYEVAFVDEKYRVVGRCAIARTMQIKGLDKYAHTYDEKTNKIIPVQSVVPEAGYFYYLIGLTYFEKKEKKNPQGAGATYYHMYLSPEISIVPAE